MLGRTLLYTALTRARQLVVIVGQKKALFPAVRDWRRAPRHTALGGLLDGMLRFAWGWGTMSGQEARSFGHATNPTNASTARLTVLPCFS
jgi:hypothetical protein